MKKAEKRKFIVGVLLFAVFVLWTICVRIFDVSAIGPQGSRVGFATVNGYVHDFTGTNMFLYTLTDWLGLVPIAVALGFAIFGLIQWIERKSIFKVDKSILALGVFYVVVVAFYLLFEVVVINYRPVLIDGVLEASYPSSTTLLVACVMPTAIIQLDARIKTRWIKLCVNLLITAFVAFTVIGRFFSGVHWTTDIVGGILISAALVTVYSAVCGAWGE